MNELNPFKKPNEFHTGNGKKAFLYAFSGEEERKIATNFVNMHQESPLATREDYFGGGKVREVLENMGGTEVAGSIKRVKNVWLYLLDSPVGVNCALVYGKKGLEVGESGGDLSSKGGLEEELLSLEVGKESEEESPRHNYRVLDKVLSDATNPSELFRSYREGGEHYITVDEHKELMRRKIYQKSELSEAKVKNLVVITDYNKDKQDRARFFYDLYNFKTGDDQVFYPEKGFFYVGESPEELTGKGTFVIISPSASVGEGLAEVYLNCIGKVSSMSLGEPKKSRKQRKKGRKKKNG